MRTLPTLLAAVTVASCAAGLPAQASASLAWETQKSVLPLNAISCPATTTCFAAGQSGAVLATTDSGATWVSQATGSATYLNGISCPSTTRCFAVGRAGTVLATANAGSSWSTSTSGATADLMAISCASTAACVAVGASGAVVRTTNGGSTWTPQSLGTSMYFTAVSCPSTGVCVAAGSSGLVAATSDGGATWSSSTVGTGSLAGVACPSTSSCFAVGGLGKIIATSDGGGSWSKLTPGTLDDLRAISCPSTTTCVAPAAAGQVLVTSDGGSSWSSQASGTSRPLTAVSCAGVSSCFASGGAPTSRTVVARTGAGGTWTTVASEPTASLHDLSCPSSMTCMAVGEYGSALVTGDGGVSWAARDVPTTRHLYGVSCAAVGTCIAVGRSGAIYATTDGGAHWASRSSGVTADLNAVLCASTTTCLAAGAGGSIVKTSDAGATWSVHVSAVAQNLAGLTCAPETSCFAVGASGTIVTSPAGGPAWSPQVSGVSGALLGISCPESSGCFTVGQFGTILRTSTAGGAWSVQKAPTARTLQGISCPTAEICFAAGAVGTVLRTGNAGSSWSAEPSSTVQDLSGVSCTGAVSCLAVGKFRTIVRGSVTDTTAPGLPTIATAPPNPSGSASATFAFAGAEAGGSFQCKLDTGGYASCSSPRTYTSLAENRHVFAVRQVDAAGNVGGAEQYAWVVDVTPPGAPTIESAPLDPGSSATAVFEFSAAEPGGTLGCSLDGAGYESCSSPKAYAGLAEGSHLFKVRQSDAAGNVGPAATHSWNIDNAAWAAAQAPPAPAVTDRPPNPSNSSSAAFGFTGEPGARLECKLDSAPFASCTSPKAYSGLGEGRHTFRVRQVDAAGRTSQPSVYNWRIDLTIPVAPTLSERPPEPSTAAVTFRFAGEPEGRFECRLDSTAFETCSSPKTYSDLTDGSHDFAVRQVDAAGNVGPAASHAWTVDAVAPGPPTITAAPDTPSRSATATVAFTGAESGGTFECRLDAAAFSACSSPKTYSDLAPNGAHAFQVHQVDAAGNVGPEATHSWAVNADGQDPPDPLTDWTAGIAGISELPCAWGWGVGSSVSSVEPAAAPVGRAISIDVGCGVLTMTPHEDQPPSGLVPTGSTFAPMASCARYRLPDAALHIDSGTFTWRPRGALSQSDLVTRSGAYWAMMNGAGVAPVMQYDLRGEEAGGMPHYSLSLRSTAVVAGAEQEAAAFCNTPGAPREPDGFRYRGLLRFVYEDYEGIYQALYHEVLWAVSPYVDGALGDTGLALTDAVLDEIPQDLPVPPVPAAPQPPPTEAPSPANGPPGTPCAWGWGVGSTGSSAAPAAAQPGRSIHIDVGCGVLNMTPDADMAPMSWSEPMASCERYRIRTHVRRRFERRPFYFAVDPLSSPFAGPGAVLSNTPYLLSDTTTDRGTFTWQPRDDRLGLGPASGTYSLLQRPRGVGNLGDTLVPRPGEGTLDDTVAYVLSDPSSVVPRTLQLRTTVTQAGQEQNAAAFCNTRAGEPDQFLFRGAIAG